LRVQGDAEVFPINLYKLPTIDDLQFIVLSQAPRRPSNVPGASTLFGAPPHSWVDLYQTTSADDHQVM